MAPADTNKFSEDLEKELARALKKEKIDIKLGSQISADAAVPQPDDGAGLTSGEPEGVPLAADEPAAEAERGSGLNRPDYFGPVQSRSQDDPAKPSPALDVEKKPERPGGPTDFDEPAAPEAGNESLPPTGGGQPSPTSSPESKSIGPGPQEMPAGEVPAPTAAAEGQAEAQSQEGQPESGKTASGDEPPSAPGGQTGENQAGGGEPPSETGKQPAAEGESPSESESLEDQPAESASASAEAGGEDQDRQKSRELKKIKEEERRKVKKESQKQAKAAVEQAVKKGASKMGLRALNYGSGATLVGLIVPLIIMNVQLVFTVAPILLKFIPLPEKYKEIARFNFSDLSDIFDMLVIILLDILIAGILMLLVAIIHWLIQTITDPFKIIESLGF